MRNDTDRTVVIRQDTPYQDIAWIQFDIADIDYENIMAAARYQFPEWETLSVKIMGSDYIGWQTFERNEGN